MWESSGYGVGMRVTVDRVGRVVIPKALRDSTGIGADTELEVVVDGTGIRLEPVRGRDRVVGEADDFPLLGLVGGGVLLRDADVARLRDELQP